MELKFRNRDYKAEVDIHSLRRIQTEFHPLSPQSPLCDQVDVKDYAKDEFFDPLRGNNGKPEDSTKDLKSTTIEITTEPYMDVAIQFSGKEWTSYKKVLMQKFPVSKMISVSSLSSSIMKTGKGTEKLSANVHLEELDDPQRFADEGVKYVTLKEYVSRLTELKDEISRSWHANDRVTSLNLSIKGKTKERREGGNPMASVSESPSECCRMLWPAFFKNCRVSVRSGNRASFGMISGWEKSLYVLDPPILFGLSRNQKAKVGELWQNSSQQLGF